MMTWTCVVLAGFLEQLPLCLHYVLFALVKGELEESMSELEDSRTMLVTLKMQRFCIWQVKVSSAVNGRLVMKSNLLCPIIWWKICKNRNLLQKILLERLQNLSMLL